MPIQWKRSIKVVVLALFSLSASHGLGADFHVSLEGDDGNPGTKERPFATLAHARDTVREQLAKGLKEPVRVLLHDGTYELSEALVLGPEDSGTENSSVTYAAFADDNVVISGGRRIVGWKQGEGNVWTVHVPGVKEQKWYPRQLFVNGRRATRARTPNADASPPMVQMLGAELAEDFNHYTITLTPGTPGIAKNWKNLGDTELVAPGDWGINRKRIKSVDEKTGVIHLAPPHVLSFKWNCPRADRWCFFENAREFLDQPGEWYLDRQTGTITYWARENEDMAQAEVVAPRLTQLLEVVGTPKRPIRNLHFQGIRFEHTDWDLPAAGYIAIQACHFIVDQNPKVDLDRIPAAIRWDYVESSSITDSTIAHLGGVGIALYKGCHRNVIEGNHIFDISANGVMLGGLRDEPSVPKDNRIANNHIHTCGIDFHGSVGIWVCIAQRVQIAHNLIHDLPYSGISIGWQWDTQLTACKDNIIEHNHIHDVMKKLADGGGIYTLGFQPGSVIRDNYIHDVHRSEQAQGSANNGMFIDEGSKGFLFERNVIYRTAGEPTRFNKSQHDWHTWKDNTFLTEPPYPEDVGVAGLAPRD